MSELKFTYPRNFPEEKITRIGVVAVIVGVAYNGRLIGYFKFADDDISAASWSPDGKFHQELEDESCNDIFDEVEGVVSAYQPGEVLF